MAIGVMATIAIVMGTAGAQVEQGSDWTFSGVDRIEFEGISGDLVVERAGGSELELALRSNVRPDGAFVGEVDQQGSTVRIDERWTGSSSRGNVEWILSVPASLEPVIVMKSAGGGLEASGVEASFRFRTASGDVRVSETALDGPSRFSSASGNVVVTLDDLGSYDLEASSASGNVRIDTAFGDDFTLILTKREDRGHITSPFAVTSQRTFLRNDQKYIEQTIIRASGSPESRLRTASGSIVVRDRS